MAGDGFPGMVVNGRYRLLTELGSGGLGRVWKARDEHLMLDVAVKAIAPPPGRAAQDRADRTAGTVREARNAARLRAHPNIVPVHDVLTDGVPPWIVMELVAGRSLEAELRTAGRLPGPRVREIARAALSALDSAHREGIVHRGVKPSNVLLADDGRILLTDFGIAVHAPGIGNALSLPPERTERGEDGPAGDLFCLGVTLYRALDGADPFHRPTPSDTPAAVLTHHPAPPGVGGPLAELVMRLLEKDPAARPTAEAALALLDPAPAESPEPAGVEPLPVPVFDLQRRGYDPVAVDAYFALPPASRPARGAFDLVRRGYNRLQVDEAISSGRADGRTAARTAQQSPAESADQPPRKRSWWR